MSKSWDLTGPHPYHEVSDPSIDDPEWIPDAQEPTVADDSIAMGQDGGHQHEGLRTIHGVIDLLHGIASEWDEWVDREQMKGRDAMNPWLAAHLKLKEEVVRTSEKRPEVWRCVTYTGLGATGTKIADGGNDRSRLVVTNWGPGIVYLSHDSNAQVGQNVIQVPVSSATFYAPREMFHDGDVYAIPASGQTPVIDVLEEGARR
jgi:hypothetical protein